MNERLVTGDFVLCHDSLAVFRAAKNHGMVEVEFELPGDKGILTTDSRNVVEWPHRIGHKVRLDLPPEVPIEGYRPENGTVVTIHDIRIIGITWVVKVKTHGGNIVKIPPHCLKLPD